MTSNVRVAGVGGGGSVTYPVQTVASSGAGPNVTDLTFAYTLPSTTAGVLYVGATAATGGGTVTITGVTYGGVAMTKVDEVTGDAAQSYASLWRLKQASLPSAGANNVVITASGTVGGVGRIIGGAVTLEGVNQTTPERFTDKVSAASSTPATITVVGGNSSANDIIISVGQSGGAFSAANQTSRWTTNINTDTGGNNAACQTSAGSASDVTHSWTIAGPDIWRIIVSSVQA
jgi:hypothetical protein